MFAFLSQQHKKIYVALCVLLCVFMVSTTHAAPNPKINYQGKLTDDTGVTVADGTYDIEFKLYTVASGGSAIWTETLSGGNAVSVQNGLFSVMLGSTTALTGVNFNQTLYLGVNVEADGEMTPRKVLGSVPAAFVAEDANDSALLGGVASTSFVRSDIADTIAASTASTLLTITQSGVGDILNLFDGATEVFTVLDGGNVGIGTSTPSQELTVAGDLRLTGRIYDSTNSAGTNGYVLQTTGTGQRWVATSSLGFAAGVSFSNSAQLAALLSDETGSGNAVFSASPTFTGTIQAALANFSATTTFATSTFQRIGIGTNNPLHELGIVAESGGDSSLLTTDGVININNTANNDVALQLYTNNGAGQVNPLMVLRNDNTAFNEGMLYILNAGTNGNAYNIRLDGVGPQIEFVENDQVSPRGKWEIQANGGEFGFNSRREDNAGFERYFFLNGPLYDGGQMMLYASTTSATRDLFVIENQISSSGARPGFSWATVGGGGTTHARLSAKGGASHNASQFYIQLANSQQVLQDVFTLDYRGFAGIGDMVPDALLDISSSTASALFRIDDSGDGDTSPILVDGSGNFGVGTSTPGRALTVAGSARITGALYGANNSAGSSGYVLQSTGSGLNWVATSTLGLGASGATVSSVALSAPTGFSVSGSPVTSSGTLTLSFAAGYEALRSASSTNWNTFYNTPSTRITDGTGLTWSGNTLNCDTASGAVQGCLTSAHWTLFNGKISSSSLDTSAELASLVTDETGSGVLVFGTNPTLSGATLNGYTSLANASTTNLTLRGKLYDVNNSAGTKGYVLLTSGTSTRWVATSTLGITAGGSGTINTGLAGYFAYYSGSGTTVDDQGVLSIAGNNIGIGSSTPTARLTVTGVGGSTQDVFAVASSTNSKLFNVTSAGRVGIGSTTPQSLLTLDKTSGLSGSIVAGIKERFTFSNSVANAVYYGDNTYIVNSPTATSTLVGKILRIEDSSNLGNVVRGLEVQAHRGTNTKGENTGISGFGRTFGVRGTTEGDAGALYEPAGLYGETRGTTQSNAIRGYSGSITSSDLFSLYQDTSAFTGTGLLMNFGNSGGSFSSTSSKFIDLQVAGTSKFTVTNTGALGIGTTSPSRMLSVVGTGYVSGTTTLAGKTYLLATTTLTGALLPSTNDMYDLGSSANRFRDLYLGGDTLHLGTSLTDEGTLSYNTTNNILNFDTDSTTNGDITFFTDDLYLDKSTGNIAVGTTTASYKLTVAGNMMITNDAATNGTTSATSTWTRTFDGPSQYTDVRALQVYNGYLYYGMGSTTAGAATLMRYDGSTTTVVWSATSTHEAIMTMHVHNDTLYFGLGNSADGEADVYSYNGSVVSYVGQLGTAVRYVNSFVTFNGDLYGAGGDGTTNGDSEVFRYDGGTTWTSVFDPASGYNAQVNVFEGSLYVIQAGSTGGVAGTNNVYKSQNGIDFAQVFTARTLRETKLIEYKNTLYQYGADATVSYIGFSDLFSSSTIHSTETTAEGAYTAEVFKGVLYEGLGSGAGDGDIHIAEGLKIFNSATFEFVRDFAVYNGQLYAGFGSSAGDADVYRMGNYPDAQNSYGLNFSSTQAGVSAIGTMWFEAGDMFSGYYDDSTGDTNAGIFKLSHSLVTAAGAYDVAEDYPSYDEDLKAGDILAYDTQNPGYLTKAKTNMKHLVAGIVSARPGFLLSSKDRTGMVPTALVGRVPVTVSGEHGPIAIGDSVTLSSVYDGTGAKAYFGDRSIGYALEAFTPEGNATSSATSTIMLYAQIHTALGMNPNPDLLTATSTDSTPTLENATLFTRLITLADHFVDGVLEVAGLRTNELCVTDSNGETCIDRGMLNALIHSSQDTNTDPEENNDEDDLPDEDPPPEGEEGGDGSDTEGDGDDGSGDGSGGGGDTGDETSSGEGGDSGTGEGEVDGDTEGGEESSEGDSSPPEGDTGGEDGGGDGGGASEGGGEEGGGDAEGGEESG